MRNRILYATTLLAAVCGWALLDDRFPGLWDRLGAAEDAETAQPEQSPAPTAAAKSQPADTPPAESAPVHPSPEAAARFRQAREKISNYGTIQAELLETVAVGERRFQLTGSYLQKFEGSDRKLRLEYKVRRNRLEGSYVEICEGDVLWTLHEIVPIDASPEELAASRPRVTRRDVRQILNRVQEVGTTEENMAVLELGLGGLPALLVSIEEKMLFDDIREEEIDGKPFTVVYGGWTEEFIRAMHDETEAPLNVLAELPLPAHVPDRVRIFLDPNDFPRRIQYLKRRGLSNAPSPMVTLDLVKVLLDGEIDDSRFEYEPPEGVYVNDITSQYLRMLR